LLSPKVAAGAFVEELDEVFVAVFIFFFTEDSSVRCNYSLNSLLNSITLKSAVLLFSISSSFQGDE
jgi:hypothetical protein